MGTLGDKLVTYSTDAQLSYFFINKAGYIFVSSYGAVGDGVTYDTESVQNAIDAAVAAGKTEVYFVGGKTYLLGTLTSTSGLTFIGDNVTITGTSGITVVSFSSHLADDVKHITSAERTAWNGKTDQIDMDLSFKNLTKIDIINSKPLRMIENFANDLFNWIITYGIEVLSNKLHITTAATGLHTNVAVFDAIGSVKTYKIIVETTGVNQARLGFAKDTKDFYFINFTDGKMYIVNKGVFDSTLIVDGNNITVNPGDEFKLTIQGQHIQIFQNSVLVGTYINESTTRYMEDDFDLKPAVIWRDGTVTYDYNVTQLKAYQRSYGKIMHLSIDDVIGILQDITTELPANLFDNDIFGWFEDMHNKYGAIFTLNLWYSDGAGFDLTQVTDTYATEFFENSEWLKFAFHAYDSTSDYSTIDSTTAQTHYDNMMTQIIRFSHVNCIDTMPRVHNYAGTIDNVRAWRDTDYGITGLLSADDSRTTVYYLNSEEVNSLIKCDDFYDEVESLFFMRTDIRLDNTLGYETLVARESDVSYRGQQNAHIMFMHEFSLYNQTTLDRMESCCQYAIENGYKFEFPMNINPTV